MSPTLESAEGDEEDELFTVAMVSIVGLSSDLSAAEIQTSAHDPALQARLWRGKGGYGLWLEISSESRSGTFGPGSIGPLGIAGSQLQIYGPDGQMLGALVASGHRGGGFWVVQDRRAVLAISPRGSPPGLSLYAASMAWEAPQAVAPEERYVELYVRSLSGETLTSLRAKLDWTGAQVKAALLGYLAAGERVETLLFSEDRLFGDEETVRQLCLQNGTMLRAVLCKSGPVVATASFEDTLDGEALQVRVKPSGSSLLALLGVLAVVLKNLPKLERNGDFTDYSVGELLALVGVRDGCLETPGGGGHEVSPCLQACDTQGLDSVSAGVTRLRPGGQDAAGDPAPPFWRSKTTTSVRSLPSRAGPPPASVSRSLPGKPSVSRSLPGVARPVFANPDMGRELCISAAESLESFLTRDESEKEMAPGSMLGCNSPGATLCSNKPPRLCCCTVWWRRLVGARAPQAPRSCGVPDSPIE